MEIDETGVAVSFQSQTFKVARYCVRRRLMDSGEPEGEGPVFTMYRGHGMGSMGGDMGLTTFLQGGVPRDYDLGAGESPTESGGKSSDTSAGPA